MPAALVRDPTTMLNMGIDDLEAAACLEVRLPPAPRLYENARSLCGGLLFGALGWGVAFPLLPPVWDYRVALAVTLAAIVGIGADVVVNNFEQRNFSLRVLSRGLEMQRGRYVRTSMSIIPGAVLSVDVHVNPVLRRLGLARVRLNGVGQLPEIPPLEEVDARSVQRLVVEQLGMTVSCDDGAPWRR